MKFKWYLHESYNRGEIEEGLTDQIGDHSDMDTIINQLQNTTYEFEIKFNWDEKNKKLTVEK